MLVFFFAIKTLRRAAISGSILVISLLGGFTYVEVRIFFRGCWRN